MGNLALNGKKPPWNPSNFMILHLLTPENFSYIHTYIHPLKNTPKKSRPLIKTSQEITLACHSLQNLVVLVHMVVMRGSWANVDSWSREQNRRILWQPMGTSRSGGVGWSHNYHMNWGHTLGFFLSVYHKNSRACHSTSAHTWTSLPMTTQVASIFLSVLKVLWNSAGAAEPPWSNTTCRTVGER